MLTYALIISKKSKRDAIYKNIEQLANSSLNRLYKVYGEYDLLAEFKMPNDKKMKDLLNQIKETDGVVTLKTFTVLHKTKEGDSVPKFVLN